LVKAFSPHHPAASPPIRPASRSGWWFPPLHKLPIELMHLARRRDTDLLVQQPSTAMVGEHGLTGVAASHQGLHQQPMAGLAQWRQRHQLFGLSLGERGVAAGQLGGDRALECVHSRLREQPPLSLNPLPTLTVEESPGGDLGRDLCFGHDRAPRSLPHQSFRSVQRLHGPFQVDEAAGRQGEPVPALAPRDDGLRAGTSNRLQAAPQATDEDAQGVIPGVGHGITPNGSRHVATPRGPAPMEHEKRPEAPTLASWEGILGNDGAAPFNRQATAELNAE
jgi:hypothetical protein